VNEIDIQAMPTEELLELMGEDLYDGYADEVVAEVEEALSRGMTPYDVLTQGLVAGMDIVGIDFRDGILFVPEVLMAAKAMKAGMAVLRPLLAETGAPTIGTVVIGTVKGDIHDIGKNLVAMMMEGAGFEVFNIGINNSVEDFMAAISEHHPDIIGMSALLTTTMPYMRVVIQSLKEKGIRDDLIVMVGGAPLNEAFADDIGADAYCRDAAVAVDTAKRLIAERRGSGEVVEEQAVTA
jgi:corrinoid protein of di/trimethylamine methyltransferase